jgi:hypothetical protein
MKQVQIGWAGHSQWWAEYAGCVGEGTNQKSALVNLCYAIEQRAVQFRNPVVEVTANFAKAGHMTLTLDIDWLHISDSDLALSLGLFRQINEYNKTHSPETTLDKHALYALIAQIPASRTWAEVERDRWLYVFTKFLDMLITVVADEPARLPEPQPKYGIIHRTVESEAAQ